MGLERIIELADVELTLGSAGGPVNILRQIRLEVAPGETVGVLGPSGSGKSSLLAVIAGIERPTAGRVRVAGQDLTAMDEDALARFRRDNLGILFQAFHLIPNMTALENVALPLELAGHRRAEVEARSLLDRVGLSERVRHYPGQLSGGEQQRVALARAMAAEPALLLADEPTGNLDEATGGLVIDLLFELRAERGTTLFLVTHDRALAARCSRILTMAGGRLSEDGRSRRGLRAAT